jgi:hypothetical protein
VCECIEGNPVEGFDLDVEAKLKRRRKTTRDQTDFERWEEIYRLLFPAEEVPSPCKPKILKVYTKEILPASEADETTFCSLRATSRRTTSASHSHRGIYPS